MTDIYTYRYLEGQPAAAIEFAGYSLLYLPTALYWYIDIRWSAARDDTVKSPDTPKMSATISQFTPLPLLPALCSYAVSALLQAARKLHFGRRHRPLAWLW